MSKYIHILEIMAPFPRHSIANTTVYGLDVAHTAREA